MNELSDADHGAETEQVSTEVETNSEATTEQDTGTEETGQADDAGEATEEPPKRVPWFQKRIDEVTRAKYDAQREADYWRGLAEGRNPTPQQPQKQDGPPQLEQFETYEDYEEARIAHVVEQRLAQARQQEQRNTVLRSYEERAAAVRASKPDYDNVVGDPTLPITPVMAEVIRESDLGPEVAYHLGTNRQEAERIASLPPHRQAAELGRIEAVLTTKAPAPASSKPIPPAPVQTVGGLSAGLSKPAEEMSMAEYTAKMRAEGRL